MLNEIKKDTEDRMQKSIVALDVAFARIRTGRAHPSILDSIMIEYYGVDTPLSQVANIAVEDARTLSVAPYEKNLVAAVEKAILKSDLGLNPTTSSGKIRLPMPPLTEENRRDLTRIAKTEAENARIAIRNIRRDANAAMKDLLKEKEITEDECRRGEETIQKLTDEKIREVDVGFVRKETDLMAM